MMINTQSLHYAGYRPYECTLKKNDPHYRGSWEKRFDDDHGKRFFVHVDLYHLPYLPIQPERPQVSMQATDALGNTFDITMHLHADTTIERMEAFFEKVWTQLGCHYYERWD